MSTPSKRAPRPPKIVPTTPDEKPYDTPNDNAMIDSALHSVRQLFEHWLIIQGGAYSDEDHDSALVDLLTALMHLSDNLDPEIDPGDPLELNYRKSVGVHIRDWALMHYYAEQGGHP